MEYEVTSKDGVGTSLFVMSEDKTRSRQEELSRSASEPQRTFYLDPASATTCVKNSGCTISRKEQRGDAALGFAAATIGDEFLRDPWAKIVPELDKPTANQSIAGVSSECVLHDVGFGFSTICRALNGHFLTLYQLPDDDGVVTSTKVRNVQRMIDPRLLDAPAATPAGN